MKQQAYSIIAALSVAGYDCDRDVIESADADRPIAESEGLETVSGPPVPMEQPRAKQFTEARSERRVIRFGGRRKVSRTWHPPLIGFEDGYGLGSTPLTDDNVD